MSLIVLADTLRRYPECQCHKLGLTPGVYVEDLHMLEGGCRAGEWVCPRLDAVRRHYHAWMT